jgi:tripartite-type tricarboxylate transporter receptor subunit TctC
MTSKFSLVVIAVRAAGNATAQAFPRKPVVLTVPFAAGGPTDTLVRNLGQAMSKHLKQQVLVENTVGAGGVIAATSVRGLAACTRVQAPGSCRTSRFSCPGADTTR